MDKLQKVKDVLEATKLSIEITGVEHESAVWTRTSENIDEALAELNEFREGLESESLKNDVVQFFNEAREKWDSEADVYNKWDNLSLEEQDDTKAQAAINVIKGKNND